MIADSPSRPAADTADNADTVPPRVSIGLPVYNGETFVAAAIDSLLAQTFDDFELIITDNASTDATSAICRAYADRDPRVRYARSEVNRGAAWNFNRAFRLARGEYFKWAAHDDLHDPAFVATCVGVLDRDPSVVLCFTDIEFVDDDDRSLGAFDFPIDTNDAGRRDLFRLYTTGGHIVNEIFGVVRADALRATSLIGGYVGSDLVLLGRLALAGRFYQVHETLFFHREHAKRSALSTGGSAGFTHWYDSSKSGRFALPFWRRIRENVKSVILSDLDGSEKLACLWDICRTANWNRRNLMNDIKQLVRRNLRSR